ncbi:alkaline phosphatase isozyme conversion aminopeptidase [Citrobacter koseri]|nr:alkaline phosphatase isozyme conversion aminopeptidase [Citrobacter koseri]
MFSASRLRAALLALGVCFILPAQATSPKPGDIANIQARHIATFFPGRMTGTPAEMLSADYLRQQFEQMGYRSDIRTFNSRYIYTARNNRKNWHNVTGSTVIAAHEGKAPQTNYYYGAPGYLCAAERCRYRRQSRRFNLAGH